jgi:hypothetical protein
MIADTIATIIKNVPTVVFVLALVGATLHRSIPQSAERYLSWILLSMGVEGLWAGLTHVLFPETAAHFIGWQTSPFQFEIGIADISLGVVALLAYWRPLAFKAAVVTFSFVFYIGLAIGHIRQVVLTGDMSPGNVGLLLALTIIKPLLLVALLIGAKISYSTLTRP